MERVAPLWSDEAESWVGRSKDYTSDAGAPCRPGFGLLGWKMPERSDGGASLSSRLIPCSNFSSEVLARPQKGFFSILLDVACGAASRALEYLHKYEARRDCSRSGIGIDPICRRAGERNAQSSRRGAGLRCVLPKPGQICGHHLAVPPGP